MFCNFTVLSSNINGNDDVDDNNNEEDEDEDDHDDNDDNDFHFSLVAGILFAVASIISVPYAFMVAWITYKFKIS